MTQNRRGPNLFFCRLCKASDELQNTQQLLCQWLSVQSTSQQPCCILPLDGRLAMLLASKMI